MMRLIVVFWLIVLELCAQSFRSTASMVEINSSAGKRVLGIIVAFEFTRSDPLMLMLSEYRSMCEGGWEPTVLFLTAAKLSDTTKRFFRQKLYCYRTQSYVPTVYSVHPRSIGYDLAEEARKVVYSRLNNHDVFIYQEEDMIVQFAHLAAYVSESETLYRVAGDAGLQEYMLGFQRYCRVQRHPSEPRQKVFNEKDLLFKEYLDEFPFFKPICINDTPYLQATNCPVSWLANPHQAVWILTRRQLDALGAKCSFLNMSAHNNRPEYVREYTSSLSLFDNHLVTDNCKMKKVIPAERLTSFLVHHYYCWEKLKDYKLVYGVDSHVKAGLVQMSTVRAAAGYYQNKSLGCWKPVIEKYREEVQLPPHVLLRYVDDRQVYLLENGKKRRITNAEVMVKHGFEWKDVVVVEQKAVVDALPLGPDMT